MPKTVIDLTAGGVCINCDTEKICAVCRVPASVEVTLSYAPSGDHDHLVMIQGRLGREAHGRLLCPDHYKEDWQRFYPGKIWETQPDTKTPAP